MTFRILLPLILLSGCRGDSEHSKQTTVAAKTAPEQQSWKPQANGLWKNASGQLAFRVLVGSEEGQSSERYITELEEGVALRDVIDEATFHALKGSYYQDKGNVYHHFSMAHGGRFEVMRKADAASFVAINGCYARDKNGVYTDRGVMIVAADLESFATTEEGCFAKDRNGYYSWDETLDASGELDEDARRAIELLGPLEGEQG